MAKLQWNLLLILLFALCCFEETNARKDPVQSPLEFNAYKLGSLVNKDSLRGTTVGRVEHREPLTRVERKQVEAAELEAYGRLRTQGYDEVSNTPEAIMLRNYRLRYRKNLAWQGKSQTNAIPLSEILFPGQTPEEYNPGERINVYADLVQSEMTQVPYGYYDIPVCLPFEFKRLKPREYTNLGSKLMGHNRVRTNYKFFALQNQACTPICVSRWNGKRRVKELIDRLYRIHLELDGLPVLMRNTEVNMAFRGYPIGLKAPENFENLDPRESSLYNYVKLDPGEYYLYNHLKFSITYRQLDNDKIQITGFDVFPVSFDDLKERKKHDFDDDLSCSQKNVRNKPGTQLSLSSLKTNEVLYSYDVTWIKNDDLYWADRWDVYFVDRVYYRDGLHSVIVNIAFVLVQVSLLICGIIGKLRKEITSYTKQQKEEGESTMQNAIGWKRIHGDVFRPPMSTFGNHRRTFSSPMLLSVVVGSGLQTGCSFGLTILLAMLGVTNPMVRGQVLTSMIFLYAVCGLIAGFWSSRIYKLCCHSGGEDLASKYNWKKNAIATAVTIPFLFGGMFTILNVVLGFAGAASSVSIGTLLNLFLIWGCISVPAVFVGAWMGQKIGVITVPTKNNEVAREVPSEMARWYLKGRFLPLWGGVVLFLQLEFELGHLLEAIWCDKTYIDMNLLFIALCCSGVIASVASVFLCYMQLRAEDHRWWWKSFANVASTGVYVFLYSLRFAWKRLF